MCATTYLKAMLTNDYTNPLLLTLQYPHFFEYIQPCWSAKQNSPCCIHLDFYGKYTRQRDGRNHRPLHLLLSFSVDTPSSHPLFRLHLPSFLWYLHPKAINIGRPVTASALNNKVRHICFSVFAFRFNVASALNNRVRHIAYSVRCLNPFN